VRMKIGNGRAKPEFDDVARIASKTGAALSDVASRAEEAWRQAPAPDPHPDATNEPHLGDDRSPA
jgi:uncharacterized protein (DUF111 family)